MRTAHSRALAVAASSLIGFLVLLAPIASSAQTTAPPAGFAYGFQVHLWHFDQVARSNVIGDVTQAGFNWMTEQIEWQSVETDVGVYDWSNLDNIVNDGTTAGLRIMLSFAHAPAFYRSDTSGLMPSDPSTFGQFMQAVASRYPGQIQAYELWNEENLDREAGPGNVDPSTYLPILEAGYAGVKAGDPTAMVLLGAPSPTGANIPGSVIDDLSYLQQLYAINAGEVIGYFDALSAHPSGFSNPPDCTPATPECSLSGGFNTDDSFFAFTRISEYCKYITEAQQAQFLVQAFNMARQLPYVGGMFQWNLNFQMAVPQSDEKWGFGIVRADYSGRPAYGALLG